MAYCSTSGTTASNPGAQAATDRQIQLSSGRAYGENATINLLRVRISIGTGAPTNLPPEKTNTRSSEASATYRASFSPAVGQHLVLLSIAAFTQAAWIASPRYLFIKHSGEIIVLNEGLGETVTQVKNAMWREDEKPPLKRIHRRTTKRGYWPIYGNSSIVRHVKTGGGAFSAITPHFDSDVTWEEASSWKLGHLQAGDVNLFPPPEAPPSPASSMLLLGVGA